MRRDAVRFLGFRVASWRDHEPPLAPVQADPGEKSDVAVAHRDVVASLAKSFDDWWRDVQPMLVNERAVGPRINPFKEIYWKQFGGGPTQELLREMEPVRRPESKPVIKPGG